MSSTFHEKEERMVGFVPAEVFPPGATIQAELDELGWTQTDLAEVMGRPLKTVSALILGKTRVTEDTARELELALGIDAEFWVNAEAYFRLHSSQNTAPSAIAVRAEIRRVVPLRHMVNRGWISMADDPQELRRRVEAFRGAPLDQPVSLLMAAKQSSSYDEPITSTQEAWVLRAKELAEALPVPAYSRAKLLEAVKQMRGLLQSPDDARRVPQLLTDAGVRFVVVEKLPGLKTDGVCFWIKGRTQPVIAMSLTHDRIDNFWFVLRHEIEHVLNEDGKDGAFILDNDIERSAGISEQEQLANAAAREFCVPQQEFRNFWDRKLGQISDRAVRQFAQRIGIHPGLVAGQVRMRLSQGPLGNDAWKRFTSHLVKIRHVVTSTALVDGFGNKPQLA
jgi:HTH-type transcriptional regulator/antitoxin HigA